MKKLIFTLCILLPIGAIAQTTISGVVTYYFNKYQGDKPDLGSTVIVIDSTKADFDLKRARDYSFGRSYRAMYNSAKLRYDQWSEMNNATGGKKKKSAMNIVYQKNMDDAQKDMDRYIPLLTQFGSETEDKFNELDRLVLSQVRKIREDDGYLKTVDANGNYSIQVKPGVYYVLIRSKNRTAATQTDILGQMYFAKVKIAENENKDVSKNFEVY